VGLLIERGADLDNNEVLRQIVNESVRCPAKTQFLLDVYHTVRTTVTALRNWIRIIKRGEVVAKCGFVV